MARSAIINNSNEERSSSTQNPHLQSIDSVTTAATLDLVNELQGAIEDSDLAPQLPTSMPACKMNNKRDIDEVLASSSDAPLFSSDDLPSSSAENYLEHRHKRQQRRTWFENDSTMNGASRSLITPRQRGPFKRTHDSAVWLPSDESTEDDQAERDETIRGVSGVVGEGQSQDSDEEVVLGGDIEKEVDNPEEVTELALVEKAMQTVEDLGEFEGPVFPYWQQQPENLKQFHTSQFAAQEKVLECVDRGEETLDLSNMFLGRIQASTLKPLRYYTKQDINEGSGQPKRYHRLTPALRIILSNNNLENAPGEIYHLKNLQVLSLRSNNLTEILPAIAQLTNLQELNVGCNQLRYLPWEIFSLLDGSLERCTVFPNPFLRPTPSTWKPISRCRPPPMVEHVASTLIAFLDITGNSIREYPPAPSSLTENWTGNILSTDRVDSESFRPPLKSQTKTPSLLELALRACYKSPSLSQLPFFLPHDSPSDVSALLHRTFALKESGGQRCSVCGTAYIVPRTEWIEWWYCIMDGPVPLLRRGCSWACWVENKKVLVRGWSGCVLPGGAEKKGENRLLEIDVAAALRRGFRPDGRRH